jgi:hypothetical protein
MSAAAKPLGGELIAREQVLDQLFARGEITPDRLAIETEAIGELNGRLRSVHLAAHLETALCCIPIRSLSMSPSEGMATRHQRLKISRLKRVTRRGIALRLMDRRLSPATQIGTPEPYRQSP